MSDPVAKAQAALEKHKATAERLRAEIARRQASGRETKALARAMIRLAKTEKRIAFIEAMSRRLDRLDPVARKVAKRWAEERKEEPKRLAKRKKVLAKRTTRDLRGGDDARRYFGIGRRRSAAETPVAETFPTGPIIPFVPPKPGAPVSRPGLLPGEYRLVDRPADPLIFDRPRQWTADYVADRIADAHATLRRLPMATRPKEFGSNWPPYTYEGVELAYQAGAGTLALGRNRVIKGTSSDEVARMTEALGWPLTYLAHDPALARAVNEWGFEARLYNEPMSDYVLRGIEMIANGLNRDRVRVT